MKRVPAALALVAAITGGLTTTIVLLLGAMSVVAGTTQPQVLDLAGMVALLPGGLIALAAGMYAARRVWLVLNPPPVDQPSEDGAA